MDDLKELRRRGLGLARLGLLLAQLLLDEGGVVGVEAEAKAKGLVKVMVQDLLGFRMLADQIGILLP